MDNQKVVTGLLMDEHTTISIIEVCQKLNVSEAMLHELYEHGLFEQPIMTSINEKMLARIQSAARIQDDLGVNVPGVVLALELLDELEQLRQELSILQHHVDFS